ncbi:MAG: CBS domain-containing protein [Candidatus Aenigmatarchaeota archaeon]
MLKIGGSPGIKLSRWAAPETTVSDIATKKVTCCMETQTVGDVLHVLSRQHRRLPVMGVGNRLKGVVSATDVLGLVAGAGKKIPGRPQHVLQVRIRDVMTRHVIDIDRNMGLPDALKFFGKHRKGAYPVTHMNTLCGIVSEHDMIKRIRGRTGIRVEDIMVRNPIVAKESHEVREVARMLSVGGFRRLPVVRDGELAGIVTPRDILTFLMESGTVEDLDEHRRPVGSVMKVPAVSIGPGRDVYDAAAVMTSMNIGGLPVTDGRQLIGIITERDIVDAMEP